MVTRQRAGYTFLWKGHEMDPCDIPVIEWHEAVRRRPAMYIGDAGPLGLLFLVRELLDVPRDPKRFTVTLRGKGLVLQAASVVPSTRPRKEGLPPYIVEVCTHIFIGMDEPATVAGIEMLDASVRPAVFRRTNHAPTALAFVNALSTAMTVESMLNGDSTSFQFSKGRLLSGPDTKPTREEDGVRIAFDPDDQIFGANALRFDWLADIARDFAAVRRVRVEVIDASDDLRFTTGPHTDHGPVLT